MKLPDRIFAVGGAGKEIAFTMFETDWVLDSVLQPRPNPHSVTVTILDTAQGEENEDRQRLREVRQKINDRQNELRDVDAGRTGDIEIEYKLATNDIQLNGQIDLLGEDTVPRIASGNGMDPEDWWLEPEHINENLDFAKGVVRKRGLGKALYYKAYAEDDDLSSYIDLPDKGKVAVLAGLGGGTGSGILMDLAKHLQDKQRTAEITLFSVLPNHTEGVEENTNAFAALSELEYLSLTGNNLFKDRILIPIDPTGFDGKTGNRIHTQEYLDEFDEAAIYLIAAYYNTQNLEDPFSSSPDYAPFTIGIPQVLRYNVQAINEARESLREILNSKRDALDAEEDIYADIDRFLTKHYDVDDDVEGGLREVDETDLRNRLESVEELLDVPLFNELEYRSLDTFRGIIHEARDEGEDIADQIDIITGSMRAGTTTGGDQTFVDSIDEALAEILERDLSLISYRKRLLQQMSAVESSQIRDTLSYLLVLEDENINPGVRLNRLETKLEEAEDRRERLENDLEDTIEELEELRDEQSDEIRRAVEEWERTVREDVEQYRRIEDINVESRLDTLYSELERFQTDVVNAESQEDVTNVSPGGVEEALDDLASDLDRVGIDFDRERQRISGSLPALKRAKEAWLVMNTEESTLESIVPWRSNTEEQREDAQKDYRMQKTELEDKEVFSIGPAGTSFTVDLTFTGDDVEREVEDRRAELENNVVGTLRDALDESHPSRIDEIRAELERGASLDELGDLAREAFREEVSGTDEVAARKEDLEADLVAAEEEVEIYEGVVDLFENLNNIRESYVERESAFQSDRAEHGEDSDRQVATQEEEYVYVKNVQPEDVLRTTGDDDISQSGLFKSQAEVQRLHDNLGELAENARRQQYTGLRHRKFSQNGSRYDDLKVRVAVLSQAIDQIDRDVLDFEETFSGAFDLGASGKRLESPYTTWQRDVGGSWDIGMSVFIDGVFLDNIRKIGDADGYRAGYERQLSKLGDDILIHHSYDLKNGYYVRRKNLLNLEDDEDVAFFLRDEPEVVDDLLDEYVETVQTGADADTTE
ncbi:MAG: tubulin-like doman-containing protein [Halobacteriaceae archaeon]